VNQEIGGLRDVDMVKMERVSWTELWIYYKWWEKKDP